MLSLRFDTPAEQPYHILCLGAHSDDIEIGCGGTLLRFAEHGGQLVVHWVVFSAHHRRRQEAEASAQAFLANVPTKQIVLQTFRDGFFPYDGGAIKDYFEQLQQECAPDLIFTHYRHDRHQDHRLISELTWQSFRNHVILEYEIPKYDGDLGSPQVFVPLEKTLCDRKVRYLLRFFHTQRAKPWFSRELFFALLRLRGMEAQASSTYAEAFYCRKMLLEPPSPPFAVPASPLGQADVSREME